MAKRMLIDSTHPEETRVAVISGNRLEEFDFESARKKQIKGNVYLAKVTRVEPSLQACFVEYGGNRHGFLAFNEIHPDYYRIPVADREALNRMVAEAMAAQEDDEEQEERRPRWRRRGRGRRPRGDSDEAQSTAGAEDGFSGNEHPSGTSDPEAADAMPGDDASSDIPGGDRPASAEPQPFDDAPRSETSPLDMAPPERTASDPVDEMPRDAAADAGFEPREEAAGAAGDDVAAANERSPGYASEDAPTEPPSFDGDREIPRREEFGDGSTGDAAPSAEPARETARGGESPVAEEGVETVGGDEVEDIRRKHRIWQRRYKIQEVIRKRQILLVQVAKEERGNKGAALTTYISLAGRYCVLMPNTPRGGGISRKITSHSDRKRLKEIISELEVPDGMAVIVRTAGMERSKPELRRDLDFLLKTWDGIREKALDSTAPALIYEEANLIKRAVRDLYTSEVEEIIVDGDEGHEAARSFMSLLMPSHIKKVVHYADKLVPLFHRYQVESQIDNMHSPSVQLRSGGYIVLNPTEALVAIDVNSGRSTRERNIEETATRTNLEAADEVARQLRLRDLAGLIVIDFIDMEESRNRHQVERRLKEALRHDRARIQVGRISPFGLLEMSRQRLRPSLVEASMMPCPHCGGAGHVRSTESMALTVLRAVEEEGLRQRSAEVTVGIPAAVALYIFNHKRAALGEIERRHGFRVVFQPDESVGLSTFRILRSAPKTTEAQAERAPEVRDRGEDRVRGEGRGRDEARAAPPDQRVERPRAEPDDVPTGGETADEAVPAEAREADTGEGGEREGGREGDPRDANGERRGRRRGRRGGRRRRGRQRDDEQAPTESFAEPPRESTLGPFGEETAAETPPAHDRLEAPEPEIGESRAIEARDETPPAWQHRGEPRLHEEQHAAAATEAAPSETPRTEPMRAEPERRETQPEPPRAPERAPAEPPPPAEPAAPPKRGWWNLRRG